MNEKRPLIALISATMAAIGPIERAWARSERRVEMWNILDDRLLVDAAEFGGVVPSLQERMNRLITHAVTEGADGILLTCSLYGSVARERSTGLSIPIFGPDDAAFNAIVADNPRRIAVVGSNDLSIADSVQRLRAHAATRGIDPDLIPMFVAGAPAASKADGVDELTRSVVAQAELIDPPVDAILIAQYSLALVADDVQRLTGVPVFSGPERAVAAMVAALQATGTSA